MVSNIFFIAPFPQKSLAKDFIRTNERINFYKKLHTNNNKINFNLINSFSVAYYRLIK